MPPPFFAASPLHLPLPSLSSLQKRNWKRQRKWTKREKSPLPSDSLSLQHPLHSILLPVPFPFRLPEDLPLPTRCPPPRLPLAMLQMQKNALRVHCPLPHSPSPSLPILLSPCPHCLQVTHSRQMKGKRTTSKFQMTLLRTLLTTSLPLLLLLPLQRSGGNLRTSPSAPFCPFLMPTSPSLGGIAIYANASCTLPPERKWPPFRPHPTRGCLRGPRESLQSPSGSSTNAAKWVGGFELLRMRLPRRLKVCSQK
mmetsp:Transcript_33642/g.66640  ORF Transcript_33642/g.66640 Transcript_33642/m.66640 type:complete len:253 (+) Transcript_33642:765-1523(+)